MNIEHRLLSFMMETYGRYPGKSHRELCLITPAYSQRFGEWKKVGIEVSKESDGVGGFRYKLLTDPGLIDTIEIRLRADVERRAKVKGKAQPITESQIGMKI